MSIRSPINPLLLSPLSRWLGTWKRAFIHVVAAAAVLAIGLAQLTVPRGLDDVKYEALRSDITAVRTQLAENHRQREDCFPGTGLTPSPSSHEQRQPEAQAMALNAHDQAISNHSGKAAKRGGEIKSKPRARSKHRNQSQASRADIGREASPSVKKATTRVASHGPKAATRKADEELDSLLGGTHTANRALTPTPLPGGDRLPGPQSTVRNRLERSDVRAGMNRVANVVRRCSRGESGPITLKVQIGKDGKMKAVAVTGKFAGSPVGDCAVRAVKTAVFPASQSDLTVSYPFSLNPYSSRKRTEGNGVKPHHSSHGAPISG